MDRQTHTDARHRWMLEPLEPRLLLDAAAGWPGPIEGPLPSNAAAVVEPPGLLAGLGDHGGLNDDALSLLLAGGFLSSASGEPGGREAGALDDDLSRMLSTWNAAAVETPPSVVAGPVLNGGEAQRSSILSVSLTFDQDVSASLGVDDLRIDIGASGVMMDLSGLSSGDLTYDPGTNTATWDLSAVAFANGYYTGILVAEGVLGDSGAAMVEDSIFSFHRLQCDANGDAKVDDDELSIWLANYDPLGGGAKTPATGDWNGDGLVDSADMALWQQNRQPLGLSIPGQLDAEANGPYTVVVGEDLHLLAHGSQGDIALYEWDLDRDGTFDVAASEPFQDVPWDDVFNILCGGSCTIGVPYEISLRITDRLGRTAADTAMVTVLETAEQALIAIDIGTRQFAQFAFDPGAVETLRPDIFREHHFSLFDILVYLDDTGAIDMTYAFDETMNTHVITSLQAIGYEHPTTNWWHKAWYDGGWPERNAFRMDHYPFKEGMTIQIYHRDPTEISAIHDVWREEIQRKNANGGTVIVPEVIIRGASEEWHFLDVEVTAHNLRADTFQDGVITAIDTVMTLGGLGLLTYQLQWYESIGSAGIVRSHWVEEINGDRSQPQNRCGFVYEAGDLDHAFWLGNHIHIPSDWRIINSPEYVEYFWICL